MKGSVSS